MPNEKLPNSKNQRLEMLLAGENAPSLSKIIDMMPGIAAAPEGDRDEDWLALVTVDMDEELKTELLSLRNHYRATQPASSISERLTALRKKMRDIGIDGFLVPRADEHQGEYVPKNAERLAYICNFTGSAGLGVILLDEAAVFTDGRYTIQVKAEVDPRLFAIRHISKEPPEEWLKDRLKFGQRLGADPKLHVPSQWKRFEKIANESGASLVAVDENPLDHIWHWRPAEPIAPVIPHNQNYTGMASAEKRELLAREFERKGIDAAILSAPDSICWLLNIRGGDIPRTPFALGYAILHKDQSVDLFMDPRKLLPQTILHLGNHIRLHQPADLGAQLEGIGTQKILMDKLTGSHWIWQKLKAGGATITIDDDPCLLPKAQKNTVEIKGTKEAHIRDGAAIVRFLHWFEQEAPKGKLTEMSAAEKLAEFRRQNDLFRDFSFDTISAAGPNGAICHYRVNVQSNRTIDLDSLYLVDSGGQYLDGTTDITRTLAVGSPSGEMRDRFTRVLKGHIALATASFPKGTTGHQLDALARMPLWQVGLDYDHGTGHGVGSYLSVHEGPQRISAAPNQIALEPGMILSNEPGFYKDGEYGIRIENLVIVVEAERYFLKFETITLAPIDLTLVETSLLSETERSWLNTYHQKVLETLGPLLDEKPREWLKNATRKI